MKDLLTVKQVADKLNLSRQSVYKKIDKEFKDYLHIVNGKKFLDKRAIGIFEEQTDNQNLTDLLSKSLRLLTEQNEALKTQLEQKDKQIDSLSKMLDQSQQLQAMAEQKIQLLETRKETNKGFWSKLFE